MNKLIRISLTSERLKEAMEDVQINQICLAKKTGLSHSTISRYLSGAVEPRQDATHKIATVLGVSELWLWGYNVPKTRVIDDKNSSNISLTSSQALADDEESALKRKIIELTDKLTTEEQLQQVLDFMEYIESKHNKDIKK